MSGSPLLRCACGSVFVPDAVFCRRCGARRPMGGQAEWPPQRFGQWPQAAGAAASAGSAPRTPGAAACSAAPFAVAVPEPLAQAAPAGLSASIAPIMSGASAEFDRIDADGDGVITRSEFVFDRLDRNHDGVISRAEFEAAVSSGQLAGSLADSREAAASSFGPATPSLAHMLQADRVAGPPFAEPLARPGSSLRLAAAPAGGPGAASGTPESVSRSQAEMTSRVGAATVHKLVGTTKNLLQGLEEALLLRAGFLAGAFHAWRCESALRRASREAERRFQQHLARSQEEWSAQLEELRRKADADRQRGGTAAAQAIRLGIASRFFAGGARVMKKETWRTWRVYCRLEARKRTAVQNAELVFLQSSARGTLHVVLSTWQKEVSRQQLQRQAHRGQKELDEAKRMMQRQLGSQANQGVALVMKKFLGSSRTGALMSAWRAWQQAVAVAKAAAAKSRSACQVLHTLLNGNRHATLRAYFVNWRSEQASSAVERAERVQLQAAQAEHEARLESVQVERQLQRAAAHKRVEQIIRKWVFGDRQGLLVWSVQEWCKVVESGRAAKRLKEVTCLTMVWALEGDRRGLLRGVVLSWRHEAQREAEASRRLREVEELQARMDSERRRREKELEASREEAARRMVKSEAVLKHMLERLFRGDMKATRSSAFREWRKMSAKSRMKAAQHQSVCWALARSFEGSKKASVHGAFLSWRGEAQRQRHETAVEDAVARQRRHWEEAQARLLQHHQQELDGLINDRQKRRDEAHSTVEAVLRQWTTGNTHDLVKTVFVGWLRLAQLHQKARAVALQAERGAWRGSGRLAMVCWRVFVVLGASYKTLQKQVEHLLQGRRSLIGKYVFLLAPQDAGAAFGAWKEFVLQERLRHQADANRTKKQQMQVAALKGLSGRCRRGALHETFGAWKAVYHQALQALSRQMAKNEWVTKLSGMMSKKATPDNLSLLSTCLNEWFREACRMLQQALHDAHSKARAEAEESGAHVGQLAQQLAGLQEQLWVAYQENDRIAQIYQKELQCKDELMVHLRDATQKARAAGISPGPPTGMAGGHALQVPASLMGPDAAAASGRVSPAVPGPARAVPAWAGQGASAAASGRVSPALAEPVAAQKPSPTCGSGCDWDEAVRRMRTEGLVRLEGQRT